MLDSTKYLLLLYSQVRSNCNWRLKNSDYRYLEVWNFEYYTVLSKKIKKHLPIKICFRESSEISGPWVWVILAKRWFFIIETVTNLFVFWRRKGINPHYMASCHPNLWKQIVFFWTGRHAKTFHLHSTYPKILDKSYLFS